MYRYAEAALRKVVQNLKAGLHKFANPVDPQLETPRFQPSNL